MAGNINVKDEYEKVIGKIQKLLNLSKNNTSQAEATAAAMKAQELIAKFNLTISDIDDSTMKEQYTINTTSFRTGKDYAWKYDLSCVIANNFRCKCWWKGNVEVVFYGYKQDTLVAKEVYEFLFKIIRKNVNRLIKEYTENYGTARGIQYTYTRGFIHGVHSELSKQCTALMIVISQEVKDAYEGKKKELGMTTMKPLINNGSQNITFNKFNHGFSDGREAMTSRGLENKRRAITA